MSEAVGHATGATPDVDEVERIAAIADPALRNLKITHCYWRLAEAVGRRTGEGANWCTWATWASKQAGRTIRGEDGLALIGSRLNAGVRWRHPIASLWRALLRRGLLSPGTPLGRLTAELHTPFDALERASAAVARGNLKVFAEIGREFARFLHEVPPRAGPESRELRAFLADLRPGDPPGGQHYLRHAFGRYQRLSAESDEKARAESLVLANLEIGFHEQTRLQPEIREALDAAYRTKQDLGRRLLDALLPRGTRRRRAVPDRAAAAVLGALGARLERAGEQIARAGITESLMVLSLPGRVLSLGVHLADPYPHALLELRDAELEAMVARFEPVAGAPDDCGARDWSELPQRMHYLAHLFRSLYALPGLSGAPFNDGQLRALAAGRIPDGEL